MLYQMAENSIKYSDAFKTNSGVLTFILSKAEKFSFSFIKIKLNGFGDLEMKMAGSFSSLKWRVCHLRSIQY